MAQYEEELRSRQLLQQLLAGFATFSVAELERHDLPTEINFAHGSSYFERSLKLFNSLNSIDLTDIPYTKLQSLNSIVTQAHNAFTDIRNFSIAKFPNNPVAQRDSFLNFVRDQYDSWFENISPTIAYFNSIRRNIGGYEKLAKEQLDQIHAIIDSSDTQLKNAINESQNILLQIRTIAQEAGVSQYAVHFKEEADLNQKNAGPWLWASSILAGFTFILGILLYIQYLFYVPILSTSQSIQTAIPKLFIFSLLLTSSVWCGKTYRAYRHNAVVNRHRQHALSTFQAFAQAAIDPATKDAVLLQATQCIFSQQPTGFIQIEPESTSLPISEMMKAINK